MSAHLEVKYRGMEPILGWQPTHAQPRPGLIEANAAVKRLVVKPKTSRTAVLTCSPTEGIQCVDTSAIPPMTILSHTVYEIAHCGVDVTKPNMFTCIVGKKGTKEFFCHVFKCESKDQAARIVRSVATACTLAFQEYQQKKGGVAAAKPSSPTKAGAVRRSPQVNQSVVERQMRASTRRQANPKGPPPGSKPQPKLTDSWFRPSMSRGEVNTILRNGRIGDFIIRESQTRPGDYAISVQTGNQIWTGLILRNGGGYNLGERGAQTFPELTDVIAFYSQNKFMNDTNGYPLTLRLPDDTTWEVDEPEPRGPQGGRGTSFKVPDWRASQRGSGSSGGSPRRGNMPSFEDIMDGNFPGLDGNAPEFSAPNFEEPKDEREAFELFMNQGGFDIDENGELVALNEVAEALEELEDAQPSSAGAGAKEDPFAATSNRSSGGGSGITAAAAPAAKALGGFDDDFAPTASAPAPAKIPAISDLAKKIFDSTPQDAERCLGGAEVRPALLRSGLDVNTLGKVWMEVDNERRGKIDYDQLCLILGMISQAQSGMEPNLATMDPETTPAPTLEGM